jgi:hypothetical protein
LLFGVWSLAIALTAGGLVIMSSAADAAQTYSLTISRSCTEITGHVYINGLEASGNYVELSGFGGAYIEDLVSPDSAFLGFDLPVSSSLPGGPTTWQYLNEPGGSVFTTGTIVVPNAPSSCGATGIVATYNHTFWSEIVFGKATTAQVANILGGLNNIDSIYDLYKNVQLITQLAIALGTDSLGDIATILIGKVTPLVMVDAEVYLEATKAKADQAVASGQCFAEVCLFGVPFPATESMGCR